MKAVILAGGLGTRLLPLTKTTPKPMLTLGEKPILEHIIDWTRNNGVKSIVLCVSYLRKNIEDYFKDGEKFGVNIEYAISNKPLATAGQLKTAEEFIDDTFVCVYGDSIFDFSLRNMIKQHNKKKSFVTMSLYEYKTNLEYGAIETTPSGKVTSWNEKPEIKANINMGCYVMEPKVMSYIPKNKPYGMDDVIKKAMKQKKLVNSFISKKGFMDIGNKESYKIACDEYVQKPNKTRKLK
ncbi:MAG: nucleotidyltransferase family protein [Thaumarchaeota archaeon]|nr:nucleotidyltransferase family protein [Nitrososphaerota archaeon]MBT5842790.1 nucleotidyltransferase family protein [Nitrososphaerota archaeon]MBT6468755.1 nucleotidyltransferase family protein [Nitrososphaerota archaeon]